MSTRVQSGKGKACVGKSVSLSNALASAAYNRRYIVCACLSHESRADMRSKGEGLSHGKQCKG